MVLYTSDGATFLTAVFFYKKILIDVSVATDKIQTCNPAPMYKDYL